jgi:DNA-binding LacI/PurR family transcriptional regulator
MAAPQFYSITEQVAAYMGNELRRGRWRDAMPGRNQLAEELDVSPHTIELAFQLLENERLLVPQGNGRPRRITVPKNEAKTPMMRVAILDHDSPEQTEQWAIVMQQQLLNQGHQPFFADKCLTELGMDVQRVKRLVKRTPADAWVVCSASRAVLEWFANQAVPAFALFGNRQDLPIAGVGPDKAPVLAGVTRHLIHLGHRRISMICRRGLRLPHVTYNIRPFLDELKAAKIVTGLFNLPEWEESDQGFERILNSLFAKTPPTALILDEPYQYHAAYQHISRRGLRVPQDVSLVCQDHHETFVWCKPSVAHIRWSHQPVVRRVVRWVNNLARGRHDRRQTLTKAEYVPGGTVGPVPKR